MPKLDSEQRKIVRAIRREGRNIRDPRLRRIYERAAVQTGLVESGLRNLSYGDADSQGWRQERAGLYPNPTNVEASVRRFRQEFQQQYDPGEQSYEVAAQVQRPRADLRGRYRQEAGEAADILRQYGGKSDSGSRSRTTSRGTYETTPAVDRSDERAAASQTAKLSYLDERGKPGALLDLAEGLKAAEGIEDTPEKRTRTGTKTVARASRPAAGTADTTRGIGGPLLEMFYDPGINVKRGKRTGRIGGHSDHVHVAGGPESVVTLGQMAQGMGLSVRENPAFDPVDPVHTAGSYHYSGRAIDVSGPSKKLRKFNRAVARIYGV